MGEGNLFSQAPSTMSLAEYTAVIGNAIRTIPGAWVKAELSDVRTSGGHWYMELIEKNEAGQTVAKLRANIWASRAMYIRRKFFGATQHDIATGLKVMVYGAATHHPVYGLSFNINDIDPSYTLGDMERLRREILHKLQKEGVIENNKLIALSPAPQRIAVISAEGAAGYGDFINHLIGNAEGFQFYPFLFPAVMQGERTSESVRDALDSIEATINLWDCVVIIRGGGATTDLNGFDEYELARRVATFPLPVVVGIGHERDRTVLDEIAHTRMKTPTAVATFFIDKVREAYVAVGQRVQWITRYAEERVIGERRHLDSLEALIPAVAQARLVAANARLEREMTRIPVLVESRIAAANARIDSVGKLLGVSADNVIKRAVAKLDSLSSLIGVLSPQNTLRRGYSITRINGHSVTNAAELRNGDIIETELKDGSVRSEVKI